MKKLILISASIFILIVIVLNNTISSWPSRDFKENRELIIQECENFINKYAGKDLNMLVRIKKPIEFNFISGDSVFFSLDSARPDQEIWEISCSYNPNEYGPLYEREYLLTLFGPDAWGDFLYFHCNEDGSCECDVEEFCE